MFVTEAFFLTHFKENVHFWKSFGSPDSDVEWDVCFELCDTGFSGKKESAKLCLILLDVFFFLRKIHEKIPEVHFK